MSVKYIDSSGNITTVAGLTPTGRGGGGMFPDYNQKIATIGAVHSYTAPKDCFLCGTYMNGSGDIGMFINGHCAYKAGTNVCILLHEGDVVTAGAPSTDYRFKVDSTYYVNPLATFEIAE